MESIGTCETVRPSKPTDHSAVVLVVKRTVGASPHTWESETTRAARVMTESPDGVNKVSGPDEISRGLGVGGKITTPVFSLSEGTIRSCPSSATHRSAPEVESTAVVDSAADSAAGVASGRAQDIVIPATHEARKVADATRVIPMPPNLGAATVPSIGDE